MKKYPNIYKAKNLMHLIQCLKVYKKLEELANWSKIEWWLTAINEFVSVCYHWGQRASVLSGNRKQVLEEDLDFYKFLLTNQKLGFEREFSTPDAANPFHDIVKTTNCLYLEEKERAPLTLEFNKRYCKDKNEAYKVTNYLIQFIENTIINSLESKKTLPTVEDLISQYINQPLSIRYSPPKYQCLFDEGCEKDICSLFRKHNFFRYTHLEKAGLEELEPPVLFFGRHYLDLFQGIFMGFVKNEGIMLDLLVLLFSFVFWSNTPKCEAESKYILATEFIKVAQDERYTPKIKFSKGCRGVDAVLWTDFEALERFVEYLFNHNQLFKIKRWRKIFFGGRAISGWLLSDFSPLIRAQRLQDLKYFEVFMDFDKDFEKRLKEFFEYIYIG